MRKKGWLWFYLALFLLVGLLLYLRSSFLKEVSPTLTPSAVQTARARWMEKGPENYVLEYLVLMNQSPRKDRYRVEVKGGQIVKAQFCPRDLTPFDKNAKDLSPYHENALAVEDLFELMEVSLEKEKPAEERKYTATAYFNKDLGYPSRYVRKNRKERGRVEFRVESFTMTEK